MSKRRFGSRIDFQKTVFSLCYQSNHGLLCYMGPALKQDPMLRHFDSDLIESKYSDFYDKSLMAFFYDLRSLVSEFKSNF